MIQLAIQIDEIRKGVGAYITYICLIVSAITQAILARSEIQSARGADSLMAHFNQQNTIDCCAIIFSIVYCVIRIIHPSQANLQDPSNQISGIEQFMPLLNMMLVILTFLQSIFYLKLNDNRAKFLTLFKRAALDLSSFLIIFLLINLMFGAIFFVLGARFDDGGNFTDDYNTDFNDYP